MIAQIKKHSGKLNLVAYTSLIIFYTNLMIDHGELKSDVRHLSNSLSQEIEERMAYESKYEDCLTIR
jgi:hypothetical protein